MLQLAQAQLDPGALAQNQHRRIASVGLPAGPALQPLHHVLKPLPQPGGDKIHVQRIPVSTMQGRGSFPHRSQDILSHPFLQGDSLLNHRLEIRRVRFHGRVPKQYTRPSSLPMTILPPATAGEAVTASPIS